MGRIAIKTDGTLELVIELAPILDQIGALALARAQRAFREQRGPGGAWPPRGVPNIAGIVADLASGGSIKSRRFDARPALRDTGRLLGSLAFRRIASNAIEVGTTVPYASLHQRGGESSQRVPRSIIEPLARFLRRTRKAGRKAGASQASRDRNDAAKRLGFLFHLARTGAPLITRVPARRFIGVTDEDRAEYERVVLAGVVAQARALGAR